jgi:DNA modification methylase
MTYTIYTGNNLDILPTLPDNSVDSIVTDPPYELGFMGKKWDNSGIAYSVELWTECLRVLKPGGHLLSFGGTRTWHRVAVAIEDAGFDVRDSIAWMYGSGFPKSLDVSKAIDKGTGENQKRQLQFTSWMRQTTLTSSKARQALLDADLITDKSNQASHYFAETLGSQPSIATADMFDALRPYLPEVPEEIERLVAERTGIEWIAYKNREVIGQKTSGIANKEEKERHTIGASKSVEVDITAPSTPEAQQWEGWGTALKPAFEPIVVARKPLAGKTVAANVLEHGTGALNIDGSRIGRADGDNSSAGNRTATFGAEETQSGGDGSGGWEQNTGGRWPANVILDEYSAGELDEQSGLQVRGNAGSKQVTDFRFMNEASGKQKLIQGTTDKGGASRFFYCAKASKRDRNEGLEGLPDHEWRDDGAPIPQRNERPFLPSKNHHPTVKPTNLMRYLVKLVTPPGGTVFDPFTGSGSTGKAAILEGFDFIGIELTEEYLPIIEGRLKHAEQTRQQELDKKDEALF